MHFIDSAAAQLHTYSTLMSHPSLHAKSDPEKLAAVFVPGGEAVTYRMLEEHSNRTARLLRSAGVGIGDSVVFCVGNRPEFLYIAWGCQRAGVIFTPVSTKTSAEDLEYIVSNSGARVLIVGADTEGATRADAGAFSGIKCFALGGICRGLSGGRSPCGNIRRRSSPIRPEGAK